MLEANFQNQTSPRMQVSFMEGKKTHRQETRIRPNVLSHLVVQSFCFIEVTQLTHVTQGISLVSDDTFINIVGSCHMYYTILLNF